MTSSEEGVLLVDKPAGITSAGLLNKLKRSCGLKKVGHAGTLDPDATGLLVVLVGKATKRQSEFMGCEKEYEGTIELGRSTSTDDAAGETLETAEVPKISKELLSSVRDDFVGEIEQIPPKVSALKVKGKRAYKRARAGEDFKLEPRVVSVSELCLEQESEQRIKYRVRASKGFYVRSMARDIGQKLGTLGFVSDIRRTKVGELSVEHAWSLEDVLDTADLSSCFLK